MHSRAIQVAHMLDHGRYHVIGLLFLAANIGDDRALGFGRDEVCVDGPRLPNRQKRRTAW